MKAETFGSLAQLIFTKNVKYCCYKLKTDKITLLIEIQGNERTIKEDSIKTLKIELDLQDNVENKFGYLPAQQNNTKVGKNGKNSRDCITTRCQVPVI